MILSLKNDKKKCIIIPSSLRYFLFHVNLILVENYICTLPDDSMESSGSVQVKFWQIK